MWPLSGCMSGTTERAHPATDSLAEYILRSLHQKRATAGLAAESDRSRPAGSIGTAAGLTGADTHAIRIGLVDAAFETLRFEPD